MAALKPKDGERHINASQEEFDAALIDSIMDNKAASFSVHESALNLQESLSSLVRCLYAMK